MYIEIVVRHNSFFNENAVELIMSALQDSELLTPVFRSLDIPINKSRKGVDLFRQFFPHLNQLSSYGADFGIESVHPPIQPLYIKLHCLKKRVNMRAYFRPYLVADNFADLLEILFG